MKWSDVCVLIVYFFSADTSPKEFLFIMAFVVPCVSIVVCYARIFYIVRKTALRSHDTGSALGNSMHCQSVRAQNNNQCKKLYATNNNKNVSDGTDVQLLPKSEDVSGESGRTERNELLTVNERNEKKHFDGKNLLESENSSALLTHSQSHGDIKSAMKFIDATIGNDYPPTLSALRKSEGNEENKLTANDRNLSNVSISRTVEFIEANGERHNSCDRDYMVKMTQDNGDSAIEESISSTENNQVRLLFYLDSQIKMKILTWNFIFRCITSKATTIAYKFWPFRLNHPVLASICHWTMIVHQGNETILANHALPR